MWDPSSSPLTDTCKTKHKSYHKTPKIISIDGELTVYVPNYSKDIQYVTQNKQIISTTCN